MSFPTIELKYFQTSDDPYFSAFAPYDRQAFLSSLPERRKNPELNNFFKVKRNESVLLSDDCFTRFDIC